MTHKVVFRRAAQREFADAALWYEERRGGLGAEFTSEVNRAIESAAQNPTRFPITHRDVRCIRAQRTVIRRRVRAASAPLHYALAARWTAQRAAAQLRRYANKRGGASREIVTAVASDLDHVSA